MKLFSNIYFCIFQLNSQVPRTFSIQMDRKADADDSNVQAMALNTLTPDVLTVATFQLTDEL